MSQSAVKATRRDIRKAFGPEAVDAIAARDTQIKALIANVNALRSELGRQDFSVQASLMAIESRLARLEQAHQAGFWARVKYLALGASFS